MIWQTEQPKKWENGHYWIQDEMDKPIMILISGLYVTQMGSDEFSHTEHLRPIRWSGPIPMPEEPLDATHPAPENQSQTIPLSHPPPTP